MHKDLISYTFSGEKPEKNKTYSEMLEDMIQNTEMGEKLLTMPPRWATAYNPENDAQEDYEDRWIVKSELFLSPGVQRDQQTNQYSEANSVDHLQITGLTTRDYLMYKRDFKNYKILNLIAILHDYHEGETGDVVIKSKEFKLNELWHTVNSTAKDLCVELFSISNTVQPSNPAKELLNINLEVAEMLKVLFQDSKLGEKYGITQKDLLDFFEGDTETQQLILESFSDPRYKQICKDYENIHEITFLLASLSCNATNIQEKALRYEALTRVLSRMDQPDEYTLAFLEQNKTLILKRLEDGVDPLVKFFLEKSENRDYIDPEEIVIP